MNSWFIYEDENNEETNIPDLAARLKKLLKISETTTPPYNNLAESFETRNLTDSNDDEQGAVAMQVSSGSDSEVEIDLYWSKITVDEL